jgi:hypothetical protein
MVYRTEIIILYCAVVCAHVIGIDSWHMFACFVGLHF